METEICVTPFELVVRLQHEASATIVLSLAELHRLFGLNSVDEALEKSFTFIMTSEAHSFKWTGVRGKAWPGNCVKFVLERRVEDASDISDA